MPTDYNVDYFIGKFSQIAEEQWCINTRASETGQRCALGWCYPTHEAASNSMRDWSNDSDEDKALMKIFTDNTIFTAPQVNNGYHETSTTYPQSTPKQRILAALYDIKAMKQPAEKEVVRYVSVPEIIKDQAFEVIMDEVKN